MAEAAADRIASLAGHRWAWPLAGVLLSIWHDQAATDAVAFFLLFVLANSSDRAMRALHLKVDHLIKVSPVPDAVTGADRLSGVEIDGIKRGIEEGVADGSGTEVEASP